MGPDEEGKECSYVHYSDRGRSSDERPYLQPEEPRSVSIAAEQAPPYGQGINTDTNNFTRGQPRLDEPEE